MTADHLTKERLKNLEKENEAFKTLLLEFIGYEDAWLLTKPGLKKNYKKTI
ncbi:hypothetical protein KXR56_07685 [Bacillus inaquosorum]|uniref:hypothetical protein n=1 Tax=Bacillus inaquosorum TaxID=483913 RepID=UPI003F13AD42